MTWNLSDKLMFQNLKGSEGGFNHIKDVKEFIKRLKEVLPIGRIWAHKVIATIDSLAGDKLK